MEENDYMVLANALRVRRKALSLTQADLGDHADCGRLFVNQLEGGKKTVRLDKLMAVMAVIGLGFGIQQGDGGFVDNPDARQ